MTTAIEKKLELLFQHREWCQAQKLLERELKKDPVNHWILTQLGVTFYEQQRYSEALPLFLQSLKIVDNCPLTLWNLAGTLDALGDPQRGLEIYACLLESTKSFEDDPCWESTEWTEALKTDCIYRMGLCFQHQEKNQKAENCYRQYLSLLVSGMNGSYSFDDVMNQLGKVRRKASKGKADRELRKVIASTLNTSDLEPKKGRRNRLERIDLEKIPAGNPFAE